MRRTGAALGGLALISAGLWMLLTATVSLDVGVPSGIALLMVGVASMSWSVA